MVLKSTDFRHKAKVLQKENLRSNITLFFVDVTRKFKYMYVYFPSFCFSNLNFSLEHKDITTKKYSDITHSKS